jgi:predicted PurR-regulated permease PerM
MKILTERLKNINVKTALLLITYSALSILTIVYLKTILEVISHFIGILTPFVYGAVFAFIFQLPNKFIEKRLNIKDEKKKKLVTNILSILLVFLIIIILLVMILPQIIDNLRLLAINIPSMLKQSEQYITTLINQLGLDQSIVQNIESIEKDIVDYISKLVPSLMTGISSFTNGITNICMGIIISIYICFDRDRLAYQSDRVVYALFNEKHYQYIKDVVKLILQTFRQFFTGQITESVIIGVLCYIGCKILNIPYASIAAVVIGITNIIPYFGPFIGATISASLILLVSPIKALIFVIFATLLQQFESNLIYPHVVGSSIGLSALLVLFAITIGGGLFGIVGMIFGLPVFSVIYELFKRYIIIILNNKNMESH